MIAACRFNLTLVWSLPEQPITHVELITRGQLANVPIAAIRGTIAVVAGYRVIDTTIDAFPQFVRVVRKGWVFESSIRRNDLPLANTHTLVGWGDIISTLQQQIVSTPIPGRVGFKVTIRAWGNVFAISPSTLHTHASTAASGLLFV
jgi:hypothetical protein